MFSINIRNKVNVQISIIFFLMGELIRAEINKIRTHVNSLVLVNPQLNDLPNIS